MTRPRGRGAARRTPPPAAALALVAAMALVVAGPGAAASDGPAGGTIAWFELVTGLLGGLSLFLYGMDRMAEALKAVAGDRMRAVLGALARNRVAGLLTGVTVTAIIQSSSVTTVMLVGFVAAGLMTLHQSIGVILGSGIGTTITAQIVAFKVTKYALVLVTVGFALLFTSRRARSREYGYAIMGLGLIFFGMTVMGEAMRPLRSYEPFLAAMRGMSNPLVGIAWAALFTALIQSSSATMGVIIVLAAQGLLSLEAGIALSLGANIGTCVTAALAALGKPREPARVAVAHVGFKVLGVLLLLPFLTPFAALVVELSPHLAPSGAATAAERLAATVPRQVANAHTLFNVGIALLFLPFTGAFARLLRRLVPDRPGAREEEVIEAKYLNRLLLRTPSLAFDAVRHELRRVGKRVSRMLADVMGVLLDGTNESLDALRARDEAVDRLYARILDYLREISRAELTADQTRELMGLVTAANLIESAGDLVETELVDLGYRRVREGVVVSAATREKLTRLHAEIVLATEEAIQAVTERDAELAHRVQADKPAIKRLVKEAEAHELDRLAADAPKRLAAYMLEIDVIDVMRRLHGLDRRLARTVPGAHHLHP